MTTSKRRRKPERKYRVEAKLQVMELSKAGTSIKPEVFAGDEKLGTLVIGRGSLTWWGSKRKKVPRFTRSEFAAKMEERAT